MDSNSSDRSTADPARRHNRRFARRAAAVALLSLLVASSCSSSAPGTGDLAADTSAAAAAPSATDSVTGDSVTGDSVTSDPVTGARTRIEVESTDDQYFVLYVRPDLLMPSELAVAVVRGENGTTTLTDGRSALDADRYRVETRLVSAPGDVDEDGIDDLAELDDPDADPLNPAQAIDLELGANKIVDRETFEALSYQGEEVAIDTYLAGLEYVKFWITGADTTHPGVYFMNTEQFRSHMSFSQVIGIGGGGGRGRGRGGAPGTMRGDIVYEPDEMAPDGSQGRYRFAFQPNDAFSFAEIALAYEALVSSAPLLAGKLAYYPFPQSALPAYEAQKALYDAYRVPVIVA